MTGTMVLRLFLKKYDAKQLTQEQMVGVQKMCLSHLILALCKCREFWQRYHFLVPPKYSDDYKKLLKEINVRGIESMRNSYVGHIWKKPEQRPILPAEVMNAYYGFSPDSRLQSFVDWLNRPGENTFPHTVLAIIDAVRKDIQVRFSISESEIVNRLRKFRIDAQFTCQCTD